jgi:peptidoglycan hydrolase-like protein with peptidoglycan-binding domain
MDVMIQKMGGQASAPPTQPPPSGGGAAPPMHVDYFGTDHNSTSQDVQPWQQKMRDRGWHEMIVDGDYGPISKDICLAFQREKGLGVDGYVGPETWNATWNLPT